MEKVHALTADISTASNIYEEQLLRNLPACVRAFEQLPGWQRETIVQVVHAVCKGMEIDLQTFPDEKSGQVRAFATGADLENYCHLMGGAPGVFWSQLIAGTVTLPLAAQEFFAYGQHLGDALQIVNILRDLPRDLQIGRCYFPQEDLRAHGLTAEYLLHAENPENAARFAPVKQKWIAWGREKLKHARAYYAALPKTQPRHRAAVAWPVLWAADTLNKLEQEPNLLNPARRVKISRQRVYGTMLATPPLLMFNTLFDGWLNAKLSN